MKKFITHGDPSVQRDDVIKYDDEEYILFSVDRQGDWHGSDRVQLWCIAGTENEREMFKKHELVPHWFETEGVGAEVAGVVHERGAA